MRTGAQKVLDGLNMRREEVLATLRRVTATNVLRTDAEHRECWDEQKRICVAFGVQWVEDVYDILAASERGW